MVSNFEVNRSVRLLSWMFAVVGVLALVVILLSCAKAATITVDDSGGKQYTSIQAAINAATVGDTIYVYNGTYSGVSILKSLTIIGESNESTIIRGNGSSGSTGVDIGQTTYASIKNIKIDNFYYGIHAWEDGVSRNNIFMSNTIMNCEYGMYIDTSLSNDIRFNTILNCSSYAILLYPSSGGNTVTYNTISNSDTGISISSNSNNNVISSNTITNNGVGINIYSSANNNIFDNKILYSNSYDFYLSSSTVTSTNNIFNTGKVYCDASSSMTVKTYLGIVVSYSNSTRIQNAYATVKVSGTAIYTGYTNASGSISNILVTAGAYSGSSTFSKNTIIVNVSYGDLLFSKNNRSVDMSISHTEYFGVNQLPIAHITSPLEGGSFAQGTYISFEGYGVDVEDGFTNDVKWYSNITGYLGSGNILLDNLSIGAHKITLIVIDSDGSVANTTVNITVILFNSKPDAYITTPTEGQSFVEGEHINFSGYGIDAEDGFLTDTSMSWSSDIKGFLGSGNISLNNLSVGPHIICLTINDSINQTANAFVNITINFAKVKNNNTGVGYSTIQDAINASSNGDVLYVKNGIYNEEITISKRISLIGESSQNTMIRGSGASDSKGAYITADYVNIYNLKIDRFWCGIYLNSNSNNTIISNTITNNTYGISLSLSTNNNITSNTITNSGNGIYLYNSKNNSIMSNAITSSSDVGIFLENSLNNNITSNTITNSSWSGIYLKSSSNNTMSFNTVANNSQNGIYFYGSNNNITSNDIYGNKQYGLYLSSGVGNTAKNNWWGDTSGPYHQTTNPSGKGDNISTSIDFVPWATSAFNAIASPPVSPSNQFAWIEILQACKTAYCQDETIIIDTTIYRGNDMFCVVWEGAIHFYVFNNSYITYREERNISIPCGNSSITTAFNFTLNGTGNYLVLANLTGMSDVRDYKMLNISVYAGNQTQNITNHPPIITGIAPNKTTVNTSEKIVISVTATDQDSDTLTYNYTTTGGTINVTGALATWLAPTVNGTYMITVTVSDGRNSTIGTIDITVVNGTLPPVTNNPPTIVIISQFAGKINGIIPITGTASDDASVQYVQLNIDNVSWITVNGTTSWLYSLDTAKLTDGKHTIKVRAYDGVRFSSEKSLEIDVKNAEDVTEPKKESKGFVPGFEILLLIMSMSTLLLGYKHVKRKQRK